MGPTSQVIDNTSFLTSRVMVLGPIVLSSISEVRIIISGLTTVILICRALLCTVLEKVVLNLLPEVLFP